MTRVMSLTGHGEVRAVPDLAMITMGVFANAPSAGEALAANTASMTKLMAVLKSNGIAAKDIATTNFSVSPHYDDGQNNIQPPRIVGYDVSNNVTVTVHKLDSMGALLDKAVTSGSNQINGIMFSISDPETAMDEARKNAVKDATRKAKLYVAEMAVTLGKIAAISEGGGVMQQPVMMRAKSMASDSAPVPISQGEQIISADVNITWELN